MNFLNVSPWDVFTDKCFAGCSDGLWDVLSPRRALQLAAEVKIQLEPSSSTLHWNFRVGLVPFLVVLIVRVCDVQARERSAEGGVKSSQVSAQGIAKMLVDQAREKRTKDNTSVIVIDFVTKSRSSFHTL